MADLAPLTYGKITGRLLALVADTNDAGDYPDPVPLTGIVVFAGMPNYVRVAAAVPSPAIVVPSKITVPVNTDGYLQIPDSASLGVYLLATDDPNINPDDWTYRVSFQLKDPSGENVSIPSFDIAVPAGSVQDLATLIPLTSSGGNTEPIVAPFQVAVQPTAPAFAGVGWWVKTNVGGDPTKWALLFEDGL